MSATKFNRPISDAMKCPECGSNSTKVMSTRADWRHEHTIGRRRACANGHRFNTVEITTGDYKAILSSKEAADSVIDSIRKAVTSGGITL